MFPRASHHSRVYSDKQFEWRPARVHIPISSFSGLIGAAGVSVGANTGAPVQQEISTFGIVSVLMDTAGDVIDHNWSLPADLDINKNIYFRLHWTSGSATTADTIDWKVFYKPIVPNSTTIAAASTALDTVIAQDTVVGAYTWQTTEWGILNAGTLAHDVEKLMLQVELDAFAAGLTEDKFPLELEIAYSPKRLRGPDGMAREAAFPRSMLSNLY